MPSLGESCIEVLPGQYFDAETGLVYNYFRDYDSATGRYVESDPLGLVGLHRINVERARRQWLLNTGQTSGQPPLADLPQTNPYDYGLDDPINVIDPRGEFGVVGWVGIGAAAAAAAAVIYSIYKCVQACEVHCPYPGDSGDPVTDQNRNAWVTGCKQKCVRTFGELGKGGPWQWQPALHTAEVTTCAY